VRDAAAPRSDAAIEAGYRAATERYAAWRQEPTPGTAAAARAAITHVLESAPAGERRSWCDAALSSLR
jgi:hypothetical protein